mmetsp:Transcript_5993/g.25472  ORF Transcript_5993/g.25472 Transcript_5993/m.25472 type:complete len:229 (-) Transcript_5993:263-949(-)
MAPPPPASSRFTTCVTASPNTFTSVFSIPPLSVAVELEHDPHAPCILTATMPSSMPTTSTSPPSACRYGRTSFSASSTLATVSSFSSRFGSRGSSSSSALPTAFPPSAYGLTTSPVRGSTVGEPAAPAPATVAAPSFGHVSGASVQSAALTARFPFGIHASSPPFASTHSPIQRSDSARRFARVAMVLFANAATRTPVASAPFRSTCARTAATTSLLYPTNVIASSAS